MIDSRLLGDTDQSCHETHTQWLPVEFTKDPTYSFNLNPRSPLALPNTRMPLRARKSSGENKDCFIFVLVGKAPGAPMVLDQFFC